MGSSVYSTPVPANGALFIVNRNQLFALAGATSTNGRDGASGSAAVGRMSRHEPDHARQPLPHRSSRPQSLPCVVPACPSLVHWRRVSRAHHAQRHARSRRRRIGGRSSAARQRCTGHSDAKLPRQLKVLWTYEAGDAIESSAAIADGVVYVGSQTGELHAVNLADGKAKWKYKASADGIGESSPAVAGGLVYIGDLAGVAARRRRRNRQGRVDVQDRHRDQVVAGRRRRQGPDRLVRLASLRARRQGRQAGVEDADRRATSTPRRRSSTAWPTSPAATRSCAASASATARRS